ncbi:hypothetical protein HanXRQr2_Chr17g0826231 [Helianthus annuus]|uniref:Uncharacterized protein n=1 Tax=Helianthus annuus TaxID=4232 RepID=A0A9K3DMI3_HELAN|nr:hypothetical protein HanXRQr2_Chr17g0826231 [Helianthus annuus]
MGVFIVRKLHSRCSMTSMQSFLILGLGRMSLWKIKPMYQHHLWRHMDMQHPSMSSLSLVLS